MRIRSIAYFAVIALACVLAGGAYWQWGAARQTAQNDYVAQASANSRKEMQETEKAVRGIYESLRTLASLPSVRALYDGNSALSPEAHTTVQQLYNNLATSVAVSEVYFTDIDFDPAAMDPETGKTQEPVLMFDELILNAGLGMDKLQRHLSPDAVKASANGGPEEAESFEYLQLKEHAAWFKTNHPRRNDRNPLDTPFVAGPEVITCDNTHYITTQKDADRAGIIFTVPVYNGTGHISGMVSAIILTRHLRNLISHGSFALSNPGYSYSNISANSALAPTSAASIAKAVSDPALIYSEAIPFGVKDWRSPWFFWAGLPNADFYANKNTVMADFSRNMAWGVIVLLTLTGLAAIAVTDRLLGQSRSIADAAKQSEAVALENAKQMEEFNEDISTLNKQLAENIVALKSAQDEIIRKGKMAQLGNVTATIAHEIRNPLGGLRTSAFVLRRKLSSESSPHTVYVDRIEAAVVRCDNIITQLLDFSRSSAPQTENLCFDDWLEDVLQKEAETVPAVVQLSADLTAGGLMVDIDPERLRRAISNLISNAYEAMMDNRKSILARTDWVPEIRIETQQTSRGIELTVADNGPGMTPEVLQKVTEPLFTTKSFGTGLGVPAIQKIAELHGGGLEISSIIGNGARFTIWLPTKEKTSVAA